MHTWGAGHKSEVILWCCTSIKCWYREACFLHCRYFDFDKLRLVTKLVTRNLNKIIDVNYYPVETAKRSNMRHRPIGLGVQVEDLQSHSIYFSLEDAITELNQACHMLKA